MPVSKEDSDESTEEQERLFHQDTKEINVEADEIIEEIQCPGHEINNRRS